MSGSGQEQKKQEEEKKTSTDAVKKEEKKKTDLGIDLEKIRGKRQKSLKKFRQVGQTGGQ